MATKPTTKQTTSKATKKPATPAKAPRAAKDGREAGRAPAKPKAATEGKRRVHAPKPDGRGNSPASPAKRMSVLEAAAQVLGKAGGDMNSREMIEAITKRGLWSSPAGKTPHATLYSAIIREIGAKGRSSRFKKTTRGRFAAGGKAG